MAKAKSYPRNRVAVTLSPEALEVYSEFAELVSLPLPTLLRQQLEQGLPYVKQVLLGLRQEDPQLKLDIAKGISAQLAVKLINEARD